MTVEALLRQFNTKSVLIIGAECSFICAKADKNASTCDEICVY